MLRRPCHRVDSSSPPEIIAKLALAALPAAFASLSAAATTAVGALSGARRTALRDALDGGARAALDRYLSSGSAIETRWLVLRVLGIATSVLLIGQQLPSGFGLWTQVLAIVGALVAYGVPTEIFRSVVLRGAERSAPVLLRILRPLELLVSPLALPILWVGRLVARQVTPPPPVVRATETEVEIIVTEGEMNGSLAHDQSEMIRNVLDFAGATAGDVMVPRTRVKAFDVKTPIAELLKQISDTRHSRYPVYRESIDNIVGIVHAKDLITHAAASDLEQVRLEELMRKPVAFVPETRSASSVLTEMRAGRHHLAIVIDEFGGVSGIVTLEDLVQQIVGDIRGEHENEEPPIVDLGDGRLVVDASIPLADLSRYLGQELPTDGAYNSLGGLIVDRLGSVPRAGTTLSAFGLDFVVREADERHVAKVEIVRAAPAPESVVPRSSGTVSAA